ncbi:hypothetical protein AGR5A_Lc30015 [Agrobacterium genomosp. 5 str. CFBP 6626]|nr:hypothetical protein AGR5A_Lc30015 [Agrobacterium genomosp. 5 str. CFBP 6626]
MIQRYCVGICAESCDLMPKSIWKKSYSTEEICHCCLLIGSLRYLMIVELSFLTAHRRSYWIALATRTFTFFGNLSGPQEMLSDAAIGQCGHIEY